MFQYILPRRPEFNSRTQVMEYQGRLDPQAVVNQHGIVDHGRSFFNNLGSGILDAAGAYPGYGNVLNLVRSGVNFLKGDAGNGWDSLLKAVPVVGNIYSAFGGLKNTGDLFVHAGGAIEQGMKGGYDSQTRLAQRMVYSNMGLGVGAMQFGGYAPYANFGLGGSGRFGVG